MSYLYMHNHDYMYFALLINTCMHTHAHAAVAYHNLDAGKDRTVHMMGDGKGRVNFLIRLDQQAAYQYYE